MIAYSLVLDERQVRRFASQDPSLQLSVVETCTTRIDSPSRTSVDVFAMEIWTPPTFSTGKVPRVIPGTSGDRKIEGDFPLDQIVINRKCSSDYYKDLFSTGFPELPSGTQIHSCHRHGASTWTVTARITTTLANGEPKLYFLKVLSPNQVSRLAADQLKVRRRCSRKSYA